MNVYKVVATPKAREDLKRYAGYLKNVKKNPQAARNVIDDFLSTKEELAKVAGSVQEAQSEKLQSLGLKRLNFQKHDYFLLFQFAGNIVKITNMFHASEDYERKLN